MLVRSSKTLVFTPDENGLVGFNFLTRSEFLCPPGLVDRLPQSWVAATDLATEAFEGSREAVQALVDSDAVVVAGSRLARREEEYLRDWRWSLPTSLLHSTLTDPVYMSLEETDSQQRQHLKSESQPRLYRRNSGLAPTPLPAPKGELVALMARRRTVRAVSEPTIRLEQLSDCLFAGLGITGFTMGAAGRLPLSMTPSGGARNPYEAYVVARAVEGLEPGLYHYSAIDHELGRMPGTVPPLSDLTGGQTWTDAMPCLVVLCADLRRTMWKYEDPNAYRVVQIEAGHIGQNIMLAATEHGLTACPTAALNHSKICRLLGLRRTTDSPIYALALGVPANEER